MNDIMVDIETLGTDYDAVITQIGACCFDRYSGEVGAEFLCNVDIDSQLRLNRVVSGGTIKFWFDQPKKNVTWIKNTVSFTRALNDLYIWIKAKSYKRTTNFWSHATFDFPILCSAYNMIEHKLPFSYRNLRDIRTLVDLSNIKRTKVKEVKTHNALDDCVRQVKYCVECFNKLKGKNDE